MDRTPDLEVLDHTQEDIEDYLGIAEVKGQDLGIIEVTDQDLGITGVVDQDLWIAEEEPSQEIASHIPRTSILNIIGLLLRMSKQMFHLHHHHQIRENLQKGRKRKLNKMPQVPPQQKKQLARVK